MSLNQHLPSARCAPPPVFGTRRHASWEITRVTKDSMGQTAGTSHPPDDWCRPGRLIG